MGQGRSRPLAASDGSQEKPHFLQRRLQRELTSRCSCTGLLVATSVPASTLARYWSKFARLMAMGSGAAVEAAGATAVTAGASILRLYSAPTFDATAVTPSRGACAFQATPNFFSK